MAYGPDRSHSLSTLDPERPVIGVTAGIATVGVAGAAAPLIAKQKLYCQACGTYNQMGAAKPYRPKPPQTTKSAPSRSSSGPENTLWRRVAREASWMDFVP